MKTLLAIVSAFTLYATAASAVTWSVVTVSATVKIGSTTGNVITTVLSTRSYLDLVSTQFSVPKSDLFVGFREDTGEVAVVRKSNETILRRIVSGLTVQGQASNATSTKQSISGFATVSSLNTDFNGFFLDSVTRSSNGGIKTLSRKILGGLSNQTITGTIKSTGKKITL